MDIKRVIIGLFFGLFLLNGWVGAESGGIAVLDKYIEIGLKSNLALKQQEFSLKKSLKALREAKGMFLPSISIEARYSRAGGGRVIDVPSGDMVNPIHRTLNQLLMVHGFTPVYPANIPNQRIPFLRETEHDTKLRLVQPIFQPAIYYNVKIKKDLTGIERARLDVFKRQLTADIKNAYFKYLQAVKVKELLDNTRELLAENLRLSGSLFRNHKVTEEVVFRSKAELSTLDQQREEAEKDKRMAAAYFNFLLNRPLETGIELHAAAEKPVVKDYNWEKLAAHALQHRSEFRQLQEAVNAARHTVGLHKSSILPSVSAVFDYGFQGEKYRFTGNDDYWMGSLLLSWNLFRGGQDTARKNQALYEKKRLETQQKELENQIKLQVKEAYYHLEVAKKAIISTHDTLKSQKEAFSIIAKKYEQGVVPQIEHIKARNDYTNAEISHIIAIYDYYIKEAHLERVSAMDALSTD
ncbi:MAG: TolC family protein [Candidatus Aminicenantes bacterium]|jgi:outer membrane protein TolC